MRQIRKYPYVYPDRRGVQLANIYPNDWLGVFWTWFHGCTLKEHSPASLQGRTISTTTTTAAQLPQHTSRKENEGKQHEQHA